MKDVMLMNMTKKDIYTVDFDYKEAKDVEPKRVVIDDLVAVSENTLCQRYERLSDSDQFIIKFNTQVFDKEDFLAFMKMILNDLGYEEYDDNFGLYLSGKLLATIRGKGKAQ